MKRLALAVLVCFLVAAFALAGCTSSSQGGAKSSANTAVAQTNDPQSQQDCFNAQQELSGAFNLYFSNLMNGSLGDHKYQNKSDAIVNLIHSQFHVGMTSDEMVSELLKVGKDAGSAAPLNADDAQTIKCPSGGTITLTGWSNYKYIPTLKCSIHGSYKP